MKNLFLLITLITIAVNAQVGIGTTNPNGKSELEISSNSKGILIPRMNLVQRNNINPTVSEKGLLVYQTNGTEGFYYFDGTQWVLISGGATVLEGKDTDISGTNIVDIEPILNFVNKIEPTNNLDIIASNIYAVNGISNNIGIGFGNGAYKATNQGFYNILLGTRSGQNIISTIGNVNEGSQNISIGDDALSSLTTDTDNIAIGSHSLSNQMTGVSNLSLGDYAGANFQNGSHNVFLGDNAGNSMNVGSNNIFVGNNAGRFSTGNYKLMIGQSLTNVNNSLIYGEIDNEILRIYGEFQIGIPTSNGYKFPLVDGAANQVLSTNGTGTLSFVNTSAFGTDNQNLTYNSATGLLSIESGNNVTIPAGDITNVIAGDGLIGGGTSGNTTLNVVAINGLTDTANNIKLGGSLTENTTITQGSRQLNFNLNGTGDFNVQDNGITRFQVLDNGRVEISSITDASGTANTGALEIANSLRIDGNEIITNNNSTLNLQKDNNGDLNVDESTLYVDSSVNRVGIGVTNPTHKLHVIGDAKISNLSGTNNRLLQTDAAGVLNDVADGLAGQNLTTNGAGNYTWQTPTTGDITNVTAGNGLIGGGTTGSTVLNVVAVNGLTSNANDVRWGGTLVQDTNINYANFDTRFNLNGTGDFIIQDLGTGVFQVADNGETTFGDDTIWRDLNTTGTIIGKLYDNIDSGIFDIYGSGSVKNRIRGNGDSFFTGGDVGFGKTNPAYQVDISETTAGKTRALSINKSDTGASSSWAIYNTTTGTGTGKKYGVFNQINSSANGNQYGTRNWLRGATASSQFGVFNNISNSATGVQYGIYNGMRGSNASKTIGVWNEFKTNVTNDTIAGVVNTFSKGTPGNGGHTGMYNRFGNSQNGNYYGVKNIYFGSTTGIGNKYGNYTSISSLANGTHYGTYNNVSSVKGWAGYFLGKNYISNRLSIGETNNANASLSIRKNSNDTDSHITLKEVASNDGARIRFENTNETNNHLIFYGRPDNTNSLSRFNFYFSNLNDNVLEIFGDRDVQIKGRLGVNYANPAYAIQLPNNANAGTGRARANAWTTYSDNRIKKEQQKIIYGLSTVLKIKPKSYVQYNSEFIDEQLKLDDKSGRKDIGFIAQELYNIIPEVVEKPKDENKNLWAVNYEKIIPVAIQAIKELNSKIENLEAENKNLKVKLSKIDALEARLNKLENKQSDYEYSGINKN